MSKADEPLFDIEGYLAFYWQEQDTYFQEYQTKARNTLRETLRDVPLDRLKRECALREQELSIRREAYPLKNLFKPEPFDKEDAYIRILEVIVECVKRQIALHELKGRQGPTEASGPHPLDAEPDIVKRRAIIRQTRDEEHQDVCKRLDFESVPLPNGWSEKYGVSDWKEAYRSGKCRSLVQKLISTDRKVE